MQPYFMIYLLIFTSQLFLLTGCISVTSAPSSQPKLMANARLALALGYLEQNEMAKAKENLEMALKLHPSNERILLAMAHYYEKVGETTSAELFYKKVLTLQPNNGDALNNYGVFLCKQGLYQQANNYFNQAVLIPSYYSIASSYENAALCSLKAQQQESAKYYFIRALEHDSLLVDSTILLAKIEIDNGEYSQARLRLLKFHQHYGYQQASLRLLIRLEEKSSHPQLKDKYQQLLEQLTTNLNQS